MYEKTKKSRAGSLLYAARNPILALVTALILMAVIIMLMGYDPFNAYSVLFTSSMTSAYGWGETLAMASVLLLSGLSYAVADRCGLINLGASGQIYMGGIAGMLVATNLEGLPMILHIPLVLLAGAIAGALYGSIAAALKNAFGASEVVTTMMLNYVAMHFCTYLISGPLKDPEGDLAQSRAALDSAVLPTLIPGTRMHMGILIAAVAVIVYAFLFWRTTMGYQMRVVGMSRSVGKYAGLNIKRNQLYAMAIAGCMAGLCGAIQATVMDGRLTIEWAGNLGFDGLAVAFLGGQNAAGMSIASIFFGILLSGADRMQMLAQVPSSIVYLFQGMVIILVVGRGIFTFSGFKKKRKHVQRFNVFQLSKKEG